MYFAVFITIERRTRNRGLWLCTSCRSNRYENNEKQRHVLYHTHPLSDGSVVGWEKLRAYTRNVGIPFGIAAELIANGNVNRVGVVTPEEAFENPQLIFDELAKRGIHIHEKFLLIKKITTLYK